MKRLMLLKIEAFNALSPRFIPVNAVNSCKTSHITVHNFPTHTACKSKDEKGFLALLRKIRKYKD
jgi:hypothetical protein